MSQINTVNVWIGMSQAGIDEFRTYRQDPENYSGPMTEQVYNNLNRMQDYATVQNLFLAPTIQGTQYRAFSLYFNLDREQASAVQDFFDLLEAQYPNQFAVLGAWWMDGRQVGTQWELDEFGERTGATTGTPVYPVHGQTWKFMPDIVVYDENGDEVSRTPAASSADLRDINLLSGQSPRRFT